MRTNFNAPAKQTAPKFNYFCHLFAFIIFLFMTSKAPPSRVHAISAHMNATAIILTSASCPRQTVS